MQYTYAFIDHLVSEGLLELDRSVFTRQVVADCDIDEPTQAYCVPVGGTPMPTDMTELDLRKWKPVHEDPELMTVVQGKSKAPRAERPRRPSPASSFARR